MFQKCATRTYLLIRNTETVYCNFYKCLCTLPSKAGSLMTADTISANSLSNDIKRVVPITSDEFKNLRASIPSQPENPHMLKVSILGEPNVGKSTLTNSLVKWKVCAVSRKVHTTRKRASAILVEDNKQIVFLDTPGFVSPEKTKKHSLEPSFVMDPVRSIREADLIAVVVDISDKWTNNRINTDILRILYDFKDRMSILVLNKIDAMKSKNRILDLTRILTDGVKEKIKDAHNDKPSMEEALSEMNNQPLQKKDVDSEFYENIEHKRGWPLFSQVFMISALKNDGVEDLRNYLLNQVVPHDWVYNRSIVTDQHPHEIALMTVREKLLEYLPNEIPYTLDLKISKWEMLSTGCPKINIVIICANSRHRSFVIGPCGKHIAACVEKSRKAMRESFRRDVVLNIAVS